MSFNGIHMLRPGEGYQPIADAARRVKPPPKDPSGYSGQKITGVVFDELHHLECKGCGSTHFSPAGVCLYCKRPNPFAAARQAAKAIEVTQLDDYAPRFVYEFGSSLTEEEAREFASMWAKQHSSPQAWIPSPPAVDGAYALKPLPPPGRLRLESDTGRPSLLSRLIARIFR